MDLEALKIRSQEIRSQFVGKRYVQWPLDFKKDVVKIIGPEFSTKEVAIALEISFPTVFSWRKKFSQKPQGRAFKPVQIVEDKRPMIELNWKQGLTAKGISFSEFKELLKEGLL